MSGGKLLLYYIQRLAIVPVVSLSTGQLFPCLAQKQPDIARPFQLRWAYEISSGINTTPATDGETIYVPLKTGNIISLKVKNGAFLWERENGGRISAVPAADIKGVYIATEVLQSQPRNKPPHFSGILRALSQSNGITLWTRVLPSPLRGTLISGDANIFGCTSDGKLYAIDKETGEIIWSKNNKHPFISSPILRGSHLYIMDEQGSLIVLEHSNGKDLGRYQTRKPFLNILAATEGTIFAGSKDGFIYAIDERTGKLKWRVRTNGAVQSIQIAGRCLLTTSLDNFIYCLSPQRGSKLWKRRVAGRIATQPLVLKESVFLSPITGEEFVVLRLRDGKVINSIFVGEDNITEASPLFSGNMVLLTTRKGLFAFSNQALDEAIQK